MNWVIERARADIVALSPYQHAAWEPHLTRLHANELPWRIEGDASLAGLNRYPEPQPPALVEGLAALYGVAPDQVLVGRGSDEGIDLLLRIFCDAREDKVVICPPTFGMYSVAARVQGAEVVAIPLRTAQGFSLDTAAIVASVDAHTKLVFVCSPNNPTANVIPVSELIDLAQRLAPTALLVVDEAYIEFAAQPSMSTQLPALPNVVVLRTLSKAHGLAGARCGVMLAAPAVIALARKVIHPYAITEMTIEAVAPLLLPDAVKRMRARVRQLLAERQRLAQALVSNPAVTKVWPSDANFLLVDFREPGDALLRIRGAGLIVRDVRQPILPRSLRLTVGTPVENDRLLESLK
jgi:histidinol-phosphate aminotransferase